MFSTGLIVIIPVAAVIAWFWLWTEFKKAPLIQLDNKFKEPPGIGKTIEPKKKYSPAHLKLYWRNEIGRTSKHIHSK